MEYFLIQYDFKEDKIILKEYINLDESIFDKYDCFIANGCPGTMTWNKHKNNKKFIS